MSGGYLCQRLENGNLALSFSWMWCFWCFRLTWWLNSSRESCTCNASSKRGCRTAVLLYTIQYRRSCIQFLQCIPYRCIESYLVSPPKPGAKRKGNKNEEAQSFWLSSYLDPPPLHQLGQAKLPPRHRGGILKRQRTGGELRSL
jgi:hypothetical protein